MFFVCFVVYLLRVGRAGARRLFWQPDDAQGWVIAVRGRDFLVDAEDIVHLLDIGGGVGGFGTGGMVNYFPLICFDLACFALISLGAYRSGIGRRGVAGAVGSGNGQEDDWNGIEDENEDEDD